jgi:hypothetical protein
LTGRSNDPDIPTVEPPCEELGFDTVLVNPDLEVASRVKAGDVLQVALADDQYPAAFLGDERVGNIATGRPGRLVTCLRENGPFEAEVLEADGGTVKVRVRHV